MKTVYLNVRTVYGVETVDEFTQEPKQPLKEFNIYVRKMIAEYHLSGQNVYSSTRPTKEWKDKG